MQPVHRLKMNRLCVLHCRSVYVWYVCLCYSRERKRTNVGVCICAYSNLHVCMNMSMCVSVCVFVYLCVCVCDSALSAQAPSPNSVTQIWHCVSLPLLLTDMYIMCDTVYFYSHAHRAALFIPRSFPYPSIHHLAPSACPVFLSILFSPLSCL